LDWEVSPYNAYDIQVQWLTLEVYGAGKCKPRRSLEEELGTEPWGSITQAGKGSKEGAVDGEL
jgi:hypothetical protein